MRACRPPRTAPRRCRAGSWRRSLEQQLAEHNAGALKRQHERDALDAELQAVREQLAEVRTAGAKARPPRLLRGGDSPLSH
ncbi:hypothetical protein [Nitrococcus mobilis]|uniref:hypothetical protein n=1 Tax=Nitrococcus mobilis TaxID=35797 RepID=UPI000317DE12|nr:hypothetical protein [Nitrococcus mobilis]